MTPADLKHVIDALDRGLTFDRPADVALSGFFRDADKLGGRDRALVAEAYYGVIRHLRSLQALAEPVTPRRLALAWLARFGGHNLREFETLVKKDADLAWLKTVKTADLQDQSEAVRLDLPDWLYERLAGQYGDHLPVLMAALNRPATLDLRVNRLKTDRDTLLAALNAEGIEAQATPFAPTGIRLAGKPALQKHPLFLDGLIEVQDEGSQLLALLTGPRRGEMVCDFCAGAGGKTLAMGAMMRSTGRLYAFDVVEKRLNKLKPRLARSGLSNVHPILLSDERDQHIKRLAGKFDRVLVDAPCSGLGTLRRNPDLKWRQTPESVAEMAVKQATILVAASRLVKSGGRMVYATCSLLAEENEAVVNAFLGEHGEFRLKPVNELLREAGISLDTGEALRLDPASHGTDGFFAAVMERV